MPRHKMAGPDNLQATRYQIMSMQLFHNRKSFNNYNAIIIALMYTCTMHMVQMHVSAGIIPLTSIWTVRAYAVWPPLSLRYCGASRCVQKQPMSMANDNQSWSSSLTQEQIDKRLRTILGLLYEASGIDRVNVRPHSQVSELHLKLFLYWWALATPPTDYTTNKSRITSTKRRFLWY